MKVLDVIRTKQKDELYGTEKDSREDFLIIEENTNEFNIVSLKYGCLMYKNPFISIDSMILYLSHNLIILEANYE